VVNENGKRVHHGCMAEAVTSFPTHAPPREFNVPAPHQERCSAAAPVGGVSESDKISKGWMKATRCFQASADQPSPFNLSDKAHTLSPTLHSVSHPCKLR